jgi:hypothetical protein
LSDIWLLPVTVLPIGVGYVLGTFGIFVVADLVRPPERVEYVGQELICEITGWGMAGAASGYEVRLYKRWSAFTFIEREVAAFTVDESAGDADKTCSDALNAYAHGCCPADLRTRHCEEQSDEAIQTCAAALDCFAGARNDSDQYLRNSPTSLP